MLRSFFVGGCSGGLLGAFLSVLSILTVVSVLSAPIVNIVSTDDKNGRQEVGH